MMNKILKELCLPVTPCERLKKLSTDKFALYNLS